MSNSTLGSGALPVNVSYLVDFQETPSGLVFRGSRNSTSDSFLNEVNPYPLFTSYYQQVKNMAAPGEPPMAGRDPDEGLVILEKIPGTPRLDNLVGINGDDIRDLQFFQGLTEDLPPARH